MLFTTDQIEELLRLVEFQYAVYIGDTIGADVLSKRDRLLLRAYGIDPDQFKGIPHIEQAFQFGRLSSALGHYRASVMSKDASYQDFKRFLSRGGHVPLTAYEKKVLEGIKVQSYSAIKGLENAVSLDIKAIISSESASRRSIYEEIIRDAAKKKVANRTSLQNMMLEIGHATGDWDRKLSRIVETEMHNAFEEGRAATYQGQDGSDVLVYKDVYAGACRHCIKHYLTGGLGSEPVIFKLSDLRANGTNVGKKANDWQPVLGAMHPYCRCTLNKLPRGYKWDRDKRSFSIPDKDVERKTDAHKRAPIKVSIGDTDYVV